MTNQDTIFLLKGKTQNYAWGGKQYIPQLLHIDNASQIPFAEYWMGAHPSASSSIQIDNEEKLLYNLIKENPNEFIGATINDKFGELPYLFKILDVQEMLSIQVHPSKEEAEKGFDAEEALGILISDKNRNYKDRNHKPEVMVALSEFWLLHGFLENEKLLEVLSITQEFAKLLPIYQQKGYKGLYQYVMELTQDEVDRLLYSLVMRELEVCTTNKSLPGYWVCKLYKNDSVETIKNIDRGVFSIYFFNIVKAMPGEAVFQGAGIPHAYLEGQNVELMANSDNVLRGGLTPKHIDVPELLKHTHFKGITPNVMLGDSKSENEQIYPCPVPDFGIAKIEGALNNTVLSNSFSAEIIIVIEGSLCISSNNKTIELLSGMSVFIKPNSAYQIQINAEKTTAFKAFVPIV